MEEDIRNDLVYPERGFIAHESSIANLLIFLSGLFSVASISFTLLFLFIDAIGILFTLGSVAFIEVTISQRLAMSGIVTALLIVTFIFGMTSKRNRNNALIASCMSSVAAACAFIGTSFPNISGGEFFTLLTLPVSGLLCVAATVLYAVGWLKSNACIAERLPNVRDGKFVSPSKKLTAGILIGVILLTAVPTVIGVPILYYKNCGKYYEQITSYMSSTDLSKTVTAMECLDRLPDNYKDVKNLKRQTTLLKEYVVEYEGSRTGAQAREAYRKMISLSKEDPRWNFDKCYDDRILYGAMWQTADGNYYLIIGENTDDDLQSFDTNLPNTLPDDTQGRVFECKSAGTVLGVTTQEIILEYRVDNGEGSIVYKSYKLDMEKCLEEVKRYELSVYCYAENKIYTFYTS